RGFANRQKAVPKKHNWKLQIDNPGGMLSTQQLNETIVQRIIMPTFFNAYDYVGYIAPGAIMLLCLIYLFPWLREEFGSEQFVVADIGVFIIVAFVLGHMLHQTRHLFETSRTLWTDTAVCVGEPVAEQDRKLLSDTERSQLLKAINEEFKEFSFGDP